MGAFKNLLKRVFKGKVNYDAENIKGYLTDTNILLSNPEILQQYDNIFIPSNVLREIENLELTRKSDKVLQYQIRRFKRMSKEVDNYIDLKDYRFTLRKDWDKEYTDNVLVQIALEKNLAMVTNDVLLRKKARLYNIVVIEPETTDFIENKGFKEIFMTEDEVRDLYADLHKNDFDLITNQYLIVYDDYDTECLTVLDIFFWNGNALEPLRRNKKGNFVNLSFDTVQFDSFEPKDAYQMCAVDSIKRNQVTQLRGRAGSGKSLISLETAWDLIENGHDGVKYEKLLIFVNPTPTKDAQELGFYTGSQLEKLLQSSVGAMLKAKFGDTIEINRLIQEGIIDILPFVDIRGFETSGKRTVLWIPEAQNLTTSLLKLGLQRVTEDAKVIIDGDYDAQVDKDAYAVDNGMKRVSEVFRGKDLYGEIELQNIYRSRIANLADKM